MTEWEITTIILKQKNTEMLRGIKVRLYLNKEQKQEINSLFGGCRFVFNQCLAYKKQRYESNKQNTSYAELSRLYYQNLKNEYDWLKQCHSRVIDQSIINLDVAYKNFFKHGRGYPKFKSKHDVQKVTFPRRDVSLKTFDETNSRLNITKKIKGLKFECSDRDRQYLYEHKSTIKSITIGKTKTDKYFASILVDGDLPRTVNKSSKSIGIDLGIEKLLTFSDGETIDNPKWIRTNEKQLKKLQRQLSKKVIGSNNRNKARLKIAKLHEKINNKKQDFLHNITAKIVNENQVIIMEDLNVSGMLKNHRMAKSIQELSLYEMRRQLEYKSKWYGRELVFVDRWFPSSKTCSKCGCKNDKLTLKDREFICEDCGNIINRDLNASINIEKEGNRIYNELLGQRLSEFTLEDYPLMDDKEEIPLKSNGRMIQEDDRLCTVT